MRQVLDLHTSQSLNEKKTRIFDVGFFISAVMALILWSLMPDLEIRDFTLYWKAVASLAHGGNPYIFTRDNSVSLNSPLGLGLLWFIGTLRYQTAKQFYLILMYFAFLWSIWVGYKMFLPPSSHRSTLNLALLATAIPFGMFFQVMAWDPW